MGSLTPDCASHHGVPAATRCAHCGKPLCVDCIVNTKETLEFCSGECLAAYTPQANTVAMEEMSALDGPLKIERLVVAAGLCVFSLLSIVLAFLLLRSDFLGYGMVCLPLIYFVLRPVVTTATLIGVMLIGQPVFVFYYYPLISGQVALSVVGAAIGVGLLYWAALKWEKFEGYFRAPRARESPRNRQDGPAAG